MIEQKTIGPNIRYRAVLKNPNGIIVVRSKRTYKTFSEAVNAAEKLLNGEVKDNPGKMTIRIPDVEVIAK